MTVANSTLRQQFADEIRPTMLLGLQDAELYGKPGQQRINDWVDWIATALADLMDGEACLMPPSERRAQLLGEISISLGIRLRALGYSAAADAIVGILCDLACQAAPSSRRVLTETEHSAAWHAIEGTAAEEGVDPDTVLNAVLAALDIDPPAADTAP